MGNCVGGGFRSNSIVNAIIGKKSRSIAIAVLGMDGVGKTTIIKAIKGDNIHDTIPTIGFGRFDLRTKKLRIAIYDLGGGERIRDIWSTYYAEVHGFIYVIDASNAGDRLMTNRDLLLQIMHEKSTEGKPILVLLNKQDAPNRLDEIQIADRLDLANLVNLNKTLCRVEICSAIKGTGARHCDRSLLVGFRWLLTQIEQRFDTIDAGVTQAVAELNAKKAREKEARQLRIQQETDGDEHKPAAVVESNNQPDEPAHIFSNKVAPITTSDEPVAISSPPPPLNADNPAFVTTVKQSLLGPLPILQQQPPKPQTIVPPVATITLPSISATTTQLATEPIGNGRVAIANELQPSESPHVRFEKAPSKLAEERAELFEEVKNRRNVDNGTAVVVAVDNAVDNDKVTIYQVSTTAAPK